MKEVTPEKKDISAVILSGSLKVAFSTYETDKRPLCFSLAANYV